LFYLPLFVVNFHSLGVPTLKFQLVNSFFFQQLKKETPDLCSRFNWKRFGCWHAKTDVDKIIKKGQGSEWFAIFHALSRILVGYVFVGARCGWGWTKSI
jgi:hypothetical protein